VYPAIEFGNALIREQHGIRGGVIGKEFTVQQQIACSGHRGVAFAREEVVMQLWCGADTPKHVFEQTVLIVDIGPVYLLRGIPGGAP